MRNLLASVSTRQMLALIVGLWAWGLLLALLLGGCAAPRAPREHPCLQGPPPAADQVGTAVPAWNVRGTLYVACGAGGKECR